MVIAELVRETIGVEINDIVDMKVADMIGEMLCLMIVYADGHTIGLELDGLTIADKDDWPHGTSIVHDTADRVDDDERHVDAVMIIMVASLLMETILEYTLCLIENFCGGHH